MVFHTSVSLTKRAGVNLLTIKLLIGIEMSRAFDSLHSARGRTNFSGWIRFATFELLPASSWSGGFFPLMTCVHTSAEMDFGELMIWFGARMWLSIRPGELLSLLWARGGSGWFSPPKQIGFRGQLSLNRAFQKQFSDIIDILLECVLFCFRMVSV